MPMNKMNNYLLNRYISKLFYLFSLFHFIFSRQKFYLYFRYAPHNMKIKFFCYLNHNFGNIYET